MASRIAADPQEFVTLENLLLKIHYALSVMLLVYPNSQEEAKESKNALNLRKGIALLPGVDTQRRKLGGEGGGAEDERSIENAGSTSLLDIVQLARVECCVNDRDGRDDVRWVRLPEAAVLGKLYELVGKDQLKGPFAPSHPILASLKSVLCVSRAVSGFLAFRVAVHRRHAAGNSDSSGGPMPADS